MEVYLDNNATTKPYGEVIQAVADTMKNYYGNPSSVHRLGLKAEKKLNESREIIASTINCSKDEIVFTSGGSESNNFLIRGFVKEGDHIITTKIEHPSVTNIRDKLENIGVRITYLNVDSNGRINIEELENSITKETRLVSIMHVNNEIGTVQDIENIAKFLKEKSNKIRFHVDGVQSYGKLKIDVKKFNIDLFSASAHKIHGPRGVGFAYIRKGLKPQPLIYGGGQEKNLRSGTENLPGAVGFAVAARIMNENLQKNFNKVLDIKKYFIEKLSHIEEVKINSNLDSHFSPYVLNVSFKGIRGEILLRTLEEKGIYVSMGSACSGKDISESSVLKAIGLSNEEIMGTVRFSFSEQNKKEEIDYAISNIEANLKLIRIMKKRK